ncbi:MAG: Omp28-related outer membrane protein [Bacteroidetes bacterium]|nr:Omp28-related outer membrane protein [Bacteroidota bacterium]
MNDTIRNYKHKYVLKRILSDNGLAGDIIPQTLMTRGNDFAKTYVINLTGINYSACSIVAFVDKYGDTDTNHRIENVQMVKVGEAKDWN